MITPKVVWKTWVFAKKSFGKCVYVLARCNIIDRIKKTDFPLRAYQEFSAFKLFVVDIGLLGAMSGLDARIILEGDRLFEEFRGSLTEQYVLQQLLVTPENDIFYWSADNASAELSRNG